MAFWATSTHEREARRQIREQVQAWSDAEPHVKVTRIQRMHRPYPDRAFWWEVRVAIACRCPPQDLGLVA